MLETDCLPATGNVAQKNQAFLLTSNRKTNTINILDIFSLSSSLTAFNGNLQLLT